jgi:hypothetical protein
MNSSPSLFLLVLVLVLVFGLAEFRERERGRGRKQRLTTPASATAQATAFAGRREIYFSTATGSGFFTAAGHFVHRRPGPAFGFPRSESARFVSFLDVFGLTLLFAGVR